ncbi:OLC1v1000131C1 [Oldenlandia corymbosa var. corymbosa]|uniref:OLC1v1000131C1 n=1 Tax=Oldenlandia corymbosa var. corymbosa TaxID=529605 RepID=A0AAV1D547_OLDCO|nr:OLC1v1000131C1 [Oldenlandia corymbosa var. corymbosa]
MAAQVYDAAELISGDGTFNDDIEQDLNLASENDRIGAVSVIGLQSSGKSTLLNRCFFANFQEMNARQGRHQTTRGVWVAKCSLPGGDQKILVIDTEGTDGLERENEGNGAFVRKTTYFALATSKVIVFNMWYNCVNLNNGGSRPLLETMFQVMARNFNPPRRVHLVIVIRDNPEESQLNTLTEQLLQYLHGIWNDIFSAQEVRTSPVLENYLNVQVVAMPHYRYESEAFDREVVSLRDLIFNLLRNDGYLPAEFIDLARRNWRDIQNDRILNTDLNRIAVHDVFCNGTKEEMLHRFGEDEVWLMIKEAVDHDLFLLTLNFGNQVNSIIQEYLSQYDEQTIHLHEQARNGRRDQLIREILKEVEPTSVCLVQKQSKAAIANFAKEIGDKLTGKIEILDPERHITEFENLLQDGRIDHATWNHPSTELEKLRKELDDFKKEADDIYDLILKKEANQVSLAKSVLIFACTIVYTVGTASFMVAYRAAAKAVGVALASGEELAMAVITFQSVTAALVSALPGGRMVVDVYEWFKIREELRESQRQNPTARKIWEEYQQR